MELKDANTMWVLIPYAIRDGVIVYKKCRVNKLVEKYERWSGETLAIYADFVHDQNEGLVSLTLPPKPEVNTTEVAESGTSN